MANKIFSSIKRPAWFRGWPMLAFAAIFTVEIWELFRPHASAVTRVIRLLIVLLALLVLAVAHYVAKHKLSSDADMAREAIGIVMASQKSVGWEWDLGSNRSKWFGDLRTMFGISSDTFLGSAEDFFKYVHRDDLQQVSDAIDHARVNHEPYKSEFRLLRPDGSVRWILDRGKFYYSKNGKPERMVGVALDITKYKQAEEELKKSEEKFAKAFRESPVALTVTSTKDHRYLEINETFERITGWRRDEVVGRTPIDIGIWVDPAERLTLVKRLLDEGSVRDLEVRLRCKNGEERIGLGSAELIQIEGETCVLSAIVDITERRRAEQALQRKDAELIEAQRLAQLGNWQWNANSKVATWSEELYRIHGLDSKLPPPPPQELRALFTAESWERLQASMKVAARTGSVQEIDLEVIRPDGSKRWVRSRARAARDARGKIVSFRGTSQDVTERKQIEQQLHEKDIRLDAVVSSAMDAIIAVDEGQRIVLFNPAAEKIFGCVAKDAIGTTINRFIPERFRTAHPAHIHKLGESGVTNRTVEGAGLFGLRSNGEEFPIEATIAYSEVEGKKLFTVIIRDITQRRRLEQAQYLTDERLRLAVQAGKMYVYEWDAKKDLIIRPPDSADVLGINKTMLSRQSMLADVHPDDQTAVADLFTRIGPQNSTTHITYRIIRPDRSIIWLENSARAFFDDDGRLLRILGVVTDITERKRAEQALQASEERFRLVANTAPVMIWMSGTDKLCTYVNETWLKFTGRPIEAELGNGWTEAVHPEDYNRCLDSYIQAFDRREPSQMEYRLRRHDGEYRWIFDRGVPMFNADSSFAGYIGSCIDITDRKLAEESFSNMGRKLIEAHEEERTWIARELHDDINQKIALLAVELERWGQRLPAARKEVHERIRSTCHQLTDIGKDIQALSHRLHSSKLEYLGIVAAARSFCKEFSEQQSVEIDFSHSGVPHTIPVEVSLSLFRVLQEALQNAAKHSESRNFRAELRGTPEEISLIVRDSGVGFDWQETANQPGLGLISMRERLQLVNGQLFVISQLGHGTTITARVLLTEQKRKAG